MTTPFTGLHNIPDSHKSGHPHSKKDGTAKPTTVDESPANGASSDTSGDDKTEKEELTREAQREIRKNIRAIREAGLDSLRPMYGFHGATSFGGYAAKRDITVNNFALAFRTSPMGRMTAGQLVELQAYVPFTGYDDARQMLEAKHVLVLRGDEGSGRSTSALSLLTTLVGDDVHDLGQDWELDSLFADDDRHHARGYILQNVPGPKIGKLAQARLGHVERTLAKAKSYLVVTVPNRSELEYGDLEQYVVDHLAPTPGDLLRGHLRWRYPEFLERRADWLADPRLTEQVDAAERPGSVVKLAAVLAETAAADMSLDGFLNAFPETAAAEARRLLCGTDQADPELRPTEQLQRCALLVAIAVFNDAPYLPVAAAAESLTQSLTAVAYPRGSTRRHIFTLRRENWLKWLRGTITLHRGDDEHKAEPGHIRFRNKELPNAIINELWQEFDAVRIPLLRWLQDFTNSGSVELRVRAAQTVGKLATDDFDYVYDEVISAWAGSRLAHERQAAAWALEAAARADHVEDRVRQRLRDWCRRGPRNRQLTAVTAYGTRIGSDKPGEALRSLRHLARIDDREMTRIAYGSVVDLFDGGQADQVLDTLREWATETNESTRRFAVICLVQIAYLSDIKGRSKLLRICAGNSSDASLLRDLWRQGLTEDYTRPAAWEALGQWSKDADDETKLIIPLRHLINALDSTCDRLRERTTWYLTFWSTYANPPSKAAAVIRSTRKS